MKPLPPWLQDEARRVLAQVDHPLARQLATELELGAETGKELRQAAARALAKTPVVRSLADRFVEAYDALEQAARERREGKR